MAMYPQYLQNFSEFVQRCSARPAMLQFLEDQSDSWCFKEAKHFLSIGCSDGDYDEQIISRCMPHLECYEAVDVDPDALQKLQDTHQRSHQYQVLTHCTKAEEWTGPTSPPDVINIMHVLYYIDDGPAFLNKCLTWLKPGGCMIIGLGHDNSFTDFFFRALDGETMTSKVRKWSHPSIESCQEHVIKGMFDLRGVVNSTVNLLTLKDAQGEEIEKFIKQMQGAFGDISSLPEDDAIWRVNKKRLSS